MADKEEPKQTPVQKQDGPAKPPPISPDPTTQQIVKGSKNPPKVGDWVHVIKETKEKR